MVSTRHTWFNKDTIVIVVFVGGFRITEYLYVQICHEYCVQVQPDYL